MNAQQPSAPQQPQQQPPRTQGSFGLPSALSPDQKLPKNPAQQTNDEVSKVAQLGYN